MARGDHQGVTGTLSGHTALVRVVGALDAGSGDSGAGAGSDSSNEGSHGRRRAPCAGRRAVPSVRGWVCTGMESARGRYGDRCRRGQTLTVAPEAMGGPGGLTQFKTTDGRWWCVLYEVRLRELARPTCDGCDAEINPAEVGQEGPERVLCRRCSATST